MPCRWRKRGHLEKTTQSPRFLEERSPLPGGGKLKPTSQGDSGGTTVSTHTATSPTSFGVTLSSTLCGLHGLIRPRAGLRLEAQALGKTWSYDPT